MKPVHIFALLLPIGAALSGCGKKEEKKPEVVLPSEDADRAQREKDMPLLEVTKGDLWTYGVRLHIPAGVNPQNPEEVNREYKLTRRYIGSVQASPDLKEAQCFEVHAPDTPVTKELVEIRKDAILLLGSITESEKPQLMWYAKPIPFIVAGMKPGTAFPELATENKALVRKLDVIAREDITVPAGKFNCIRLLTTGRDGAIEMRKTLWYAPQHGIIREETSRYMEDKLLYREEQELVSFVKGTGA